MHFPRLGALLKDLRRRPFSRSFSGGLLVNTSIFDAATPKAFA